MRLEVGYHKDKLLRTFDHVLQGVALVVWSQVANFCPACTVLYPGTKYLSFCISCKLAPKSGSQAANHKYPILRTYLGRLSRCPADRQLTLAVCTRLLPKSSLLPALLQACMTIWNLLLSIHQLASNISIPGITTAINLLSCHRHFLSLRRLFFFLPSFLSRTISHTPYLKQLLSVHAETPSFSIGGFFFSPRPVIPDTAYPKSRCSPAV